jgi:hypothetical protein
LELTFNQFSNPNQNQPDIAVGPTHTVVAWEQNEGGYEIQLSVAPNSDLPSGLVDMAVSLSESLSGSNRHPDVAIHGNTVHVIWQNSANGTVKYLRGTLDGTSALQPTPSSSSQPRLTRLGPDWVLLRDARPGSTYRILDASGATLHEARCTPNGTANLPTRFLSTPTLFVQTEGASFPALLRLGKTD